MMLGYLFCLLVGAAFSLPLRTSLSTACGRLEVPSGTSISGGDWEYDGALLLKFPNGTERMVESCRTPEEIEQLKSLPGMNSTKPVNSEGPPNQWLAWYNANYPAWGDGGTALAARWTVPSLPRTRTENLAIFPGLQPTYDPTNYDFILQPVLTLGDLWMDGGSFNSWGANAVACVSSAGYCVYAEKFDVKPGELLFGSMIKSNSSSNQYCWVVNATSLTTGNHNSISYCTKYIITFAFATFEHAPIGSISECSSLPPGQLVFTNVTAYPDFDGYWQGTLGNDAACSIDIDIFPGEDLVITL